MNNPKFNEARSKKKKKFNEAASFVPKTHVPMCLRDFSAVRFKHEKEIIQFNG